jgi:hypothetical protein
MYLIHNVRPALLSENTSHSELACGPARCMQRVTHYALRKAQVSYL